MSGSAAELRSSSWHILTDPDSVTIHVPKDTDAVIVLAQLDRRYFRELSGRYRYNLDFTVYPIENGPPDPTSNRQATNPIGSSLHSNMWERSVKMEERLRAGDYVVQVGPLHRSTGSWY